MTKDQKPDEGQAVVWSILLVVAFYLASQIRRVASPRPALTAPVVKPDDCPDGKCPLIKPKPKRR